MNETPFEQLVGATIESITGLDVGSELVTFYTDCGKFLMYHGQSCCENVQIVDIDGDSQDIIGTPVFVAEECRSSYPGPNNEESGTWTFYRITTKKGLVVIRWLGTSNGHYSESVSFVEAKEN